MQKRFNQTVIPLNQKPRFSWVVLEKSFKKRSKNQKLYFPSKSSVSKCFWRSRACNFRNFSEDHNFL